MLEDRFIPDEVNEENRPVIQYIQRINDTKIEDRESLARIRERLLHMSAGPLPVSHDISNDEKSLKIIKIASSPQREGDMRFLQSSYYAQKSWMQRLSLLAAVLFILLLAGSFAVLLTQHGQVNPAAANQGTVDQMVRTLGSQWLTYLGGGIQSTTSDQPERLALAINSVETPQHQIIKPQTWGVVLACLGDGKAQVQFTPTPDIRNFDFPCDGQARFAVVHYATGQQPTEAFITANSGVPFTAQVVACLDEPRCQSIPSNIPTPASTLSAQSALSSQLYFMAA